MDVKTGSGAFKGSFEDARALAENLVAVAEGLGLKTAALITDMDQPLASAAGNALELRHALDHLSGRGREPRVHAVVVALGGALLALGGVAPDENEGRRRIASAIAGGAAAERFAVMVRGLGGPSDLFERRAAYLPEAPVRRVVPAPRRGFVTTIDTRAIGLAVVTLGGGRSRPGAAIDSRVGFTGLAPAGAEIAPDAAPLGIVHAGSEAAADLAEARLLFAYRIGDEAPSVRDPVIARVGRGAGA